MLKILNVIAPLAFDSAQFAFSVAINGRPLPLVHAVLQIEELPLLRVGGSMYLIYRGGQVLAGLKSAKFSMVFLTPETTITFEREVRDSRTEIKPFKHHIKLTGAGGIIQKISNLGQLAQQAAEPATQLGLKQFDKKVRLFGMIKAWKKIDLGKAVELIGIEMKDVEGLICDLVGEGKIEGDFQGDKFLITSGVDKAIKILDESFQTWKEGGDRRAEKKD